MAAIDKTYLTKWSEYTALYDWCLSIGEVTDDWDNKFKPLNWLGDYSYNEWMKYTENETKEIPVWNTPIYLDIYLIRYCPLDFIQEIMKDKYCDEGGWTKEAFTTHNGYTAIKNRISSYDNYQRNGVKNPKFKWDLKTSMKGIKNLVWWVNINSDYSWSYDEDANYWYHYNEMYLPKGIWVSSTAIIKGKLTKRKLARILRKWNLPKGTVLSFDSSYYIKGKKGHYSNDNWNFELEIR